MSILGPFPLTIVENEDLTPLVFTYYPSGQGTTPQDWSGYSCSMMIRVNPNDVAPVLTLTPTLGGVAGTLTIAMTAAQATALYASLGNQAGSYDVLLTSGAGVKSHFIPASSINVVRSITR